MSKPKRSVAICGSAGGRQDSGAIDRALVLGKEIARRDMLLYSGAGKGYPHMAAKACFDAGGITIGISPAVNYDDHKDTYQYPLDGFTSIIYTGFGIKGRNVLLVGAAEITICVGGGIGTLNEFTIAYDEGKPIGVLGDSGGLSAEYKPLSQKAYKKPRHSGIVIEESDPVELLTKLVTHIS